MEIKRLHKFLVVVTICTVHLVSPAEARPTVTVSQGKLAGSWMSTREGRRIAAFRGIPYAAPPVKDLRFQSPKPASPWKGTRQATDDGDKCVQHNHFFGIYGEEDCLFLNVYSPDITKSNKLPVIVFIHGGAFHTGSSDSSIYGPDYMLDQDVVLVTLNYRLGIFGFLTFEDSVLPGNLGLKDQRAALYWVRDNIAQFGGDTNKVTLFGESAGAASVHYHMLFNSEQGLFRAGICHSGSALTAGSFQRPGDQKPLVAHLLNQTNCQFENSSAIIECLQKIQPYKLLQAAISRFPSFDSLKRSVELSPVLEPECVEDAFITSPPWNKSSSLPMIMGTNKYEALFTIVDLLKDETNETFEKFDQDYKNIIPYNLMFETNTEDPVGVATYLREFYLQDNKIDREHVLQLADLLSDGIFNYGTTEAIKNHLNKTYLYSFNYHGSKSILNLFRLENNYGPTHVDELFFFFPILRQRLQDKIKTEEDTLISKQLIEMWTNFASQLEPTPEGSEVEWEPVSTSDMEFLSINGHGNFTMDTYFYKDRMDFWTNLPFRNKPINDSLACEE